ncbi:MAG TPA: FAD-dependent oxidoreductase [Syntrophorhabdaceae bacterium]|nr:FAD-dependent oxidoreductase [Syntrophorhabdaceae bacterium]
MATYDYDIGVVGAGAAGLTVAAGAAQAGARVLILEREEALGGDCLHYGCVPSKALIRCAHVYHLLKSAPRFGLPQVTLKRPDFRQIAARIQSVIDAIQKHDSKERFCDLGAQVLLGEAVFEDDRSVSLNGKRYSAKSWVIATGSRAAIPPIPGLTQTPYVTNREIFGLKELPESLAIIGGGPIGIELAQAFTRLGTKVTVIEFLGQILNADDPDMAGEVMNVLKTEGVEFHLDSQVVRTIDTGQEREVTFKKKDEVRSVRAQVLLVATGRRVNLDGLGLEKIGVAFDQKGLRLDGRLRTSRSNIYGAGDVTGVYQFTHAAGYEGGIVLANTIFHVPKKVSYSHVPWVTYADPELASIGLNEKAAKMRGIKYSTWSEPFEMNDRGVAEGEITGKIKMLLDEKERPIGVAILGPRAGDLLAEWVAVLNGNVRLSTLASAVHPYPTLGEINRQVAGRFLATKIFSDRVKKALKLFFNLKGRACGPGA